LSGFKEDKNAMSGTIDLHVLQGRFPEGKFGEVVAAFDEAGLGDSLRQQETVKFSNGHIDLSVAIIEENMDQARSLVAIFNEKGWMENPRIEHKIITYNEPTPERAQALMDELRNTPL
jgi:hypothetical protein